MKQWGILMSNVIERDEEVRYINGNECLLIEICTNIFFLFLIRVSTLKKINIFVFI